MTGHKKIAIIADIHGNSWALEAVLEDIQKRNVNQIINLGDIFYGPLNPYKTFEIISKLDIQHIAGNADRFIIEVTIDNKQNPTVPLTNKTLKYVVDSFSKTELKWIHALPKTLHLNTQVYACHGNTVTDDLPLIENITSNGITLKNNDSLSASVKDVEQSIILCAHTHVSRFIQLRNGKVIINPGSIGLPAYTDDFPFPHKMENYSPFARYSVIEIQDEVLLSHEQIGVKYDWNTASKMAEKNNRIDWANWLLSGIA